MLTLSAPAYRQLRRTLLTCGPFANPAELKSLFVDARIHPWRDAVPEASSDGGRANVIIDFLARQHDAQGRNALILFLHVLADQKDPADECYAKLMALAESLSEAVPSAPPRGNEDGHEADGAPLVEPPAVARPVNLSFESLPRYGQPPGWFNSAGFVFGAATDYTILVEDRVDRPGTHCVRFEHRTADADRFGSLMQRCYAGSYLGGAAIRLAAELKVSDVLEGAGIWLRADGADDSELFFDNMSNRLISGSTGWRDCLIEAHLPPGVRWLNYGILLLGSGTVWGDNFRLERWRADRGRWEPL
jgi:hypothetical protein